jgi:hypothetical protein
MVPNTRNNMAGRMERRKYKEHKQSKVKKRQQVKGAMAKQGSKKTLYQRAMIW